MDNIFIKYTGRTLEDWIEENDEFYNGGGVNNPHACKIEFYQYFLENTDFITAKIIEAQALGLEIKDYSEVLLARQYARDQVNKLEDIMEQNNLQIAAMHNL